jgi:hypothetical protein
MAYLAQAEYDLAKKHLELARSLSSSGEVNDKAIRLIQQYFP